MGPSLSAMPPPCPPPPEVQRIKHHPLCRAEGTVRFDAQPHGRLRLDALHLPRLPVVRHGGDRNLRLQWTQVGEVGEVGADCLSTTQMGGVIAWLRHLHHVQVMLLGRQCLYGIMRSWILFLLLFTLGAVS